MCGLHFSEHYIEGSLVLLITVQFHKLYTLYNAWPLKCYQCRLTCRDLKVTPKQFQKNESFCVIKYSMNQ